jgi:hypothetical protein
MSYIPICFHCIPLFSDTKAMRSSTILRLFLLVSVVMMVGVIIVSRWTQKQTTHRMMISSATSDEKSFLVDTPACKIPEFDPWDASVTNYVTKGEPIICEPFATMTYTNGSYLYLDWNEINNSPFVDNFGHCKYQPIFRPIKADYNDDWKYLEYSEPFRTAVEITYEFIRVDCFDKTEMTIYTNFYTFVFAKSKVEKRCKKRFQRHLKQNKVNERLNVVMLGVDSVSRLNFMRQMLETRRYLLDALHAVELTGYNKVSDNTFVNVVPMTMGKYLEDIPWDETMSQVPFDKYDFLWKQFSSNGYRTLYAEDKPDISIFDYLKAGFHKSPTDYFNRAFSLAIAEETRVRNQNQNCVTDRLETDIMLDYLHQFSSVFQTSPHFAFVFLTGLTHDSLESAGAADSPYLNFFRRMKADGNLNNSVVVFFSDHGMRFGDIRQTYMGKLEERLPFMFLVFPEWFKVKYPNIATNLRTNAHRLTTPFDIYETVKSILYFDGFAELGNVENRGISLFNEIPTGRTCSDASLMPHWCTCLQHASLALADDFVLRTARAVVQMLNTRLKRDEGMCESLSLQEVQSALKVIPSDKVLTFQQSLNDVINRRVLYGDRVEAFVDYQLTVRTSPGDALFEATVRFVEGTDKYTLVGDVSRINTYGNQSHCVDNHVIKKLCYCKIQLGNSGNQTTMLCGYLAILLLFLLL